MIRSKSRPELPTRLEQIETVAAELFFKMGYHGTSLRDIARAVGVQPASIYHHFESKQALLYAVLARTLDHLIDSGQRVLVAEPDPRSQLRGLVREFVKLVAARPREGAVGDTEMGSLEPANRAALIEKRDRYQRMLEHVIEYGCQLGYFQVADVKITVFAILGMCNHVSLWFRPNGRLQIEEVAELMSELALRLVSATSPEAVTGHQALRLP